MKDNDQSGANTDNKSANEPDGQQQGKETAGSGNASENGNANADQQSDKSKKSDKPDGVTPEIQAYIDSQAAAARRKGEEKGKKDKEDEIEAAKLEEQRKANLEAGKHKEEYDNEVTAHAATKTTLSSVQREHDQLKAALAGQVPNPLDNYKRIVGDDYDAMVEDAKQLATSFGNNAHRDPNVPPIVPNINDGGKFEQNNKDENKVTTDDINRNRGNYSVL